MWIEYENKPCRIGSKVCPGYYWVRAPNVCGGLMFWCSSVSVVPKFWCPSENGVLVCLGRVFTLTSTFSNTVLFYANKKPRINKKRTTAVYIRRSIKWKMKCNVCAVENAAIGFANSCKTTIMNPQPRICIVIG